MSSHLAQMRSSLGRAPEWEHPLLTFQTYLFIKQVDCRGDHLTSYGRLTQFPNS
jgi:hypothetical protein